MSSADRSRRAERRRLLARQTRLRNRWHWWSVTVRDHALAHLDALTAELATVDAELVALDAGEATP